MMPENSPLSRQGPPPEPQSSAPPGDSRRVWTTEELLGADREVVIRHGDDLYRLRITRHGKLILYK